MAAPLLVCPECGSQLQTFDINIGESMFMCIGDRKRDHFRGLAGFETKTELQEVRGENRC